MRSPKQLSKRKAPAVTNARPRASERVCNIEIGGERLCLYPLDDVMEQFGKRWTLLVVGAMGRSRRRFNEIQADLAGISSRTLTERLKALEQLGLLHREAFNEVPLRVEYSLSPEGRKLLAAMVPLLRWAAARQ